MAAVLDYLSVRGMSPGPLFTYQNGPYFDWSIPALDNAALTTPANLCLVKYGTHSFRIGAATTAARNGIEDSIIKTLGRLESLAYLQYVQIPREHLIEYSGQLIK